MSAEPTAPPMAEIADEGIQDALVHLYALPKSSLESIEELAHTLDVSFAEAAVQSGLVTQQQVDEALDWARRQTSREGGLIAEVLRRSQSKRRELVLYEGPQLRPSDQLIVAHDPSHAHSESIRSLSTELLMRTRNSGGAIIALVSPCSDEGRSQLAAELAIAFSQLGRRTLLVDADLRRPRQHLLFDAENSDGLADSLSDGGGSPRLHRIGKLPQMALLTSGTTPSNPLELLSGNRFEQLAIEWRRSFEYVILDTPPAVESSDAIAVASAAGNVLVLSRAGVTPFSAMKEMSRKLGTTYARTLGAVIGKF
jgi:receptor protein-tyrosine kinase